MTATKSVAVESRPRLLPLLAAAVVVSLAMTAVLGYQIARRAAILANGADILLKTAPVDPRDLLRGDYVILSYDVSTVAGSLITGERPANGEQARLWVRLKPGEGGFWSVAEAAFSELPLIEGSVVMRSQPFMHHDYGTAVADQSFFVDYGIERFYVPEGEGLAIEDARNDGEVSMAVRVGAGGDAQIRALLIDGKPVYDEPLY